MLVDSTLYQSRSALSTRRCCPSPGSEGVKTPLVGEPVAMRGELVFVFVLGVLRLIGVTVPLGGTGILMSSGEDGIISCSIPEIVILDASLL